MQEEEGIEREKGKEPETWRGGRGKAEGGEQKRNRLGSDGDDQVKAGTLDIQEREDR